MRSIKDMTEEELSELLEHDITQYGHGITPLESVDDPIGFIDKTGRIWRPVLIDGILKKEEFI